MVHNIAIDGPAGAGKSTVAKKWQKSFRLYTWTQEPCIGLWHFIF